jgi:hypothetical protein
MERTLTTLLTCFLFTRLFGQVVPLADSAQRVKSLGLKSITTKFKTITDLKRLNGLEVVKIKFNQAGQKIYEKYFRLFDAREYTEEFYYKYDNNGFLFEKLKIQKNPKETTTTKWAYIYNDKGLVDKEFEYLKKDDNEPSLLTTYQYDVNGRITKATHKHLRAPEQNSYLNMSYEYFHNDDGVINGIKESYTNSDYVVMEKYKYKGKLLAEKTREANGYIGMKTTYEYNEQKKLKKELTLNDDEQAIEYSYGERGLLARKTVHKNGIKSKYEYSYSDSGQLTEEFWFSEKGTKAFSFVTFYEM